MNFSFDAYRPFIAKFLGPILGAIIAGFILWLKTRWGIQVVLTDTDMAALINNLIDAVILMISTGVTAVTLNKKVNPGNAASSHIAGEEALESKQLKQISDTAARRAKAKERL